MNFQLKNGDGSIEILQAKLLGLQVCTSLHDLNFVVRQVNEMYACGTTGGWVLTGEPECAPVRCADDPGRTHYILDA